MRLVVRSRALGAVAVTLALAGCNGTSPTVPDMPVPIATGPQVLRITYQGQCSSPDGRPFLPIVYTRVVVSRIGTDWYAAASTPESGDVELWFHMAGIGVISGSMPIAGTIRGTALHVPDVLPSLPPSTARVNFGNDGRTALNGFAFAATALVPVAGVSGVGTGTITASDAEGRSCTGSTFSWGLGPQS